MEKRASIGRAAFGAFLEYKNHVPVMTVLLAMAWSFGCDKVTGGTIEFISLKSNQYSYKIHNLTLSKIPIGYGESPPHCFNPETIKIDTMSVNCVPTTHDVTTCEW